MNISDETLSAFLDAELPEYEMEKIRHAIALDDNIADRLAELAMVDPIVQDYYQRIDQHPVPQAILALLDETTVNQADETAATVLTAANDEASSVNISPLISSSKTTASETTAAETDNIVAFPWWRRAQQQVQQYAAAVAIVALVAGYGVSQYGLDSDSPTQFASLESSINMLLETQPSGQPSELADNKTLSIRLSFYNQQGDFCRQYGVQSSDQQSEYIACKQQGEWQQLANIALPTAINTGEQYQTASGASAIDSVLDTMMSGAGLTLTEEQQALDNLQD